VGQAYVNAPEFLLIQGLETVDVLVYSVMESLFRPSVPVKDKHEDDFRTAGEKN
jgi:hypothetical protein